MERLRQIKVRRVVLVFALSLAFLIGVGVAHTGHLIDASWAAISVLGVLVTLKHRRLWLLAWMVALGLSLGWWRGSVYMHNLAQFRQHYYQRVTIVGVASDDATYNDNKQLAFDTRNVRIARTGQQLTGKISISGFGTTGVFAGDSFTASGRLYPSRGSYQGRISFAQLTITGHSTSLVNDLRRKFVAGMETALPEPLASFGMGLLIGQKANLPDDTYNALLMVGLVHIIAVSGYNLTIILQATEGLFKKHSKRLSTLLALTLIGVFLLFAGNSASIVRAAVISVLAIIAAYYGRKFKPLVLLFFAAALTAWANPYYVWTDVSWYLSFLAFCGVMIVAPLVLARLPKRLQNSLVITVAIESLCAEIMTLPYVLHIFGQMSFVALLANVLVVALVPLAMLLSLVAGLSGMLVPALSGWFALPAKLLLTYMLDIANMLSRIPHIFVQNWVLPLTSLLVLYAAVAIVVLGLRHKTKQPEFAILTDKNEQ
jgi:competence protein ComEC